MTERRVKERVKFLKKNMGGKGGWVEEHIIFQGKHF